MCCLLTAASPGATRLDFDTNPAAPDLVCPAPTARAIKPPAAAPRPRLNAEDVIAALGAGASDAPPAPDPALLTHFRLDNANRPGRPLRLALWGDSHSAAGGIEAALRRALSNHGLGSDQRAIAPTAGRAGVTLPFRKHCLVGKWRFEPLYLAGTASAPGGPGLANLHASGAGSEVWIDLRNSQRQSTMSELTLLYLPPDTEVALEVSVDGLAPRALSLPAAVAGSVGPGRITLGTRKGGLSTVQIRVLRGPFRWQGAWLSPLQPQPVQLDVFAFPSATVRGWARVDVDYLREALPPGGYDAVVMQYGTNEGNVETFDAHAYAMLLAAALGRLRAVFPDASCVLMGPTDRGVPLDQIPLPETGPPGRAPMPGQTLAALLRYSEIHRQITEIQTETAARYRCAAWNWQAFMGGRGGAYRWSQDSPRLMAPDLIHLTQEGYRRSGSALARWLGWHDPGPAPPDPR